MRDHETLRGGDWAAQAHPVTWARACERCLELRDVEVVP